MVYWSKQAQKDLKNTYDHIYGDSPQNAKMVLDTLLELGDGLDKMPLRHPKEPFYGKHHTRYARKWKYKLIYRVHGKENNVTIKRVLHTKQDSKKNL